MAAVNMSISDIIQKCVAEVLPKKMNPSHKFQNLPRNDPTSFFHTDKPENVQCGMCKTNKGTQQWKHNFTCMKWTFTCNECTKNGFV